MIKKTKISKLGKCRCGKPAKKAHSTLCWGDVHSKRYTDIYVACSEECLEAGTLNNPGWNWAWCNGCYRFVRDEAMVHPPNNSREAIRRSVSAPGPSEPICLPCQNDHTLSGARPSKVKYWR